MRGSQSNMKHRASIVSDLYSRSLYVFIAGGLYHCCRAMVMLENIYYRVLVCWWIYNLLGRALWITVKSGVRDNMQDLVGTLYSAVSAYSSTQRC